MAQTESLADPPEDPAPKKRSRMPLLAGLVGAVLLGGGSFYAIYSGLILAPGPKAPTAAPLDMDFAYIPLENITISLAGQDNARVLRFSGQIEVASRSESEMARMQPRFLDLVNTYLRAVDPKDLSEPAALLRLRAQILRRLQVIAGEGHVRDFLITEFIIN